MTAADLLTGLGRANLAAALTILGVLALRKPMRSWFGARMAYGLWLLPLLAGAAVLAPARRVMVLTLPVSSVPASTRLHQIYLLSRLGGAAPHFDFYALAVGVWVAGVVGATLLMAHLQLKFLRQARAGFGGPAVVGVFAPRIHTPADFTERFDTNEQALVLAHEAAHIARQDSRVNGLCAAAQCLFWFNPLVQVAVRALRTDQELACDAEVVERFPLARRAYAEVLLKAQLSMTPLPLGCNWPSENQHPLVERVAMLKLKHFTRGRRTVGAIALGFFGVGTGVGAWAAQPADISVAVKSSQDSFVISSSPFAVDAPNDSKSALKRYSLPKLGAQSPSASLQVGVAAVYAPSDKMRADVTAAATPADVPILGPIDITADMVTTDDDLPIVQYKGHVDVEFSGKHIMSDHVSLVFSRRSKTPGERPEQVVAGMFQSIEAHGHVLYVSDEETVTADNAVYGPAPDTLTLTGNVVLVQGHKVGWTDKIVVDLKSARPTPLTGVHPDASLVLPL